MLSRHGQTDLNRACVSRVPLLQPVSVEGRQRIPVELDVLCEILATEIKKASPEHLAQIRELAAAIPIEFVSHGQFKRLTREAKAIVLTGEHTPYSNIILQSGVDFT